MANGVGKSDSHVLVTLRLDRRLRDGIDASCFRITDIVGCAVLEILKLNATEQQAKVRRFKEFQQDPDATIRGYRVVKDQ